MVWTGCVGECGAVCGRGVEVSLTVTYWITRTNVFRCVRSRQELQCDLIGCLLPPRDYDFCRVRQSLPLSSFCVSRSHAYYIFPFQRRHKTPYMQAWYIQDCVIVSLIYGHDYIGLHYIGLILRLDIDIKALYIGLAYWYTGFIFRLDIIIYRLVYKLDILMYRPDIDIQVYIQA